MPRFPFLDLAEVNRPFMPDIRRRIAAVVSSGRYIGGPEVAEFEQRLADSTGVRHAIGVSNGLDALRLIIRGYIETGAFAPGDEIIVAANTYVASVLAISETGLKPVLADPSGVTLNLNPDPSENISHPAPAQSCRFTSTAACAGARPSANSPPTTL